jgi:nitroimidazol reductase NimA-like FMN-containing flavoprotein (pyridoxamine 5'-phosphate oxidase superfamily)
MRRKRNVLITDRRQIDEIISACQVCHLGMALNGEPYVVPITFGYDGSRIYLHTGFLGRKIDYWETNSRVCVQFEDSVTVIPNKADPCKTGLTYRSVIGWGTIREIEDATRKGEALSQIMLHYGQGQYPFSAEAVDSVRMWEIEIENIAAKKTAGL